MSKTIDLNTSWDFYLETLESKKKSSYTVKNFKNITNHQTVNLPHDWSISQEFTKKYSTQNQSASLPGGIAWYTKVINYSEYKYIYGKYVTLDIGGIYMQSHIYINNSLVSSNLYGYNSYSVDISKYLKEPKDIEITILVINMLPNSRWYSGSGIYRPINLRVSGLVHIKPNGIALASYGLQESNGEKANITIKTEIENSSKEDAYIQIKHVLVSPNGKRYEDQLYSFLKIKPGKSIIYYNSIEVYNPVLWSVNNPEMYKLSSSIIDDGLEIDTVDTDYGIRYFSYDKEKGLKLNDEYIKLKGVCLHHDNGCLGACAYSQAIQRKLEIMKEMGINAIRTSHNPESKDLIKLCNRLGLLVIEEAFDTWEGAKTKHDFSTLFKKKMSKASLNLYDADRINWEEFVIKTMVKRDRNDPCIFLWSLGNEIVGNKLKKTALRLSSYAENEDPYMANTRKKILAQDDIRHGLTQIKSYFNKGFSENDNDENNITVAGVNYIKPGAFEKSHSSFPEILMFSTESSSAVRSRGEYFHPDTIINNYSTKTKATINSQMSGYDNDVPSWANTAMFDMKYDLSLDYVLGQFVWTGFDYLGEPTPFTDNSSSFYPSCSFFGITDTAGFEKDIYYFYQSQWLNADEKPVLHLLPHWNLTEKQLIENKYALVVAYTNAKRVDLRAKKPNETEYISLGIKEFKEMTSSSNNRKYYLNSDDKATYKMALEWKVAYDEYKDYVIYAVAVDDAGNEIEAFNNSSGRKELIKNTEDKYIKLSKYNYSSAPLEDKYALHYITVDILDTNHNLNYLSNALLHFKLEGDGEIIGVDNGNSNDTDKNKFSDRSYIRAFHGKALVIIKANTREELSLTVSTDTGIQETITIN